MKQLTKTRIKSTFFSALPMGIYLVFAVIAIIVSMIILMAVTGSDESNEWIDLITHVVSIAMGALTAMALVKSRNNTKLRDFAFIKNFDWAAVIMLTLFGFSAGEVLDHFGGLILSNFMTVEPNRGIEVTLPNVISAVIIAPLFEELIFRFGGCELTKGAYSMPVICIANGLFFAAVHGYNIQGFANVMVFGITAAYVYCKTGNILYTIITHSLHNAICCISFDEFSLFGTPVYTEKNGFILGGWWWVAINTVITAACLVYYFKVFRKKYTEDKFDVNYDTGLPDTAIEKEVQTADFNEAVTA